MAIIAHLDMDAFFAAIEERDNPQWRGFPIVVGADPKGGKGRGVVSTANYAARKFGIHSAMPISQAWRAAQEGKKNGGSFGLAQDKMETIFLPGSMRHYGDVSRNVMAIIERHTNVVEQVSVDEAFIDLSFAGSFKKAEAICRKIKNEIKKKERLTASIGLASNKLVAKIASDMQKPDGLTMVLPQQMEDFMKPLALRKIPGIGPKAQVQFERKGIRIVTDALKLTEADLYDMMGEWGLELYEKLRGQGSDEVVTESEDAKSIGEQTTFDEDTLSIQLIAESLELMAESIIYSLKKDDFASYRRVVLTVRFEDFKTVTRSHTLPESADTLAVLKREMMRMLLPFLDRRENPEKKKIRLVGIRIEQLEPRT